MREWLPALVACLCVTVTTRADDPAISPEMRRLADLFAGTWFITETSASGRTVHGEEVWRTEPGGMPLVEQYHSRTPTGGDDYEPLLSGGTAASASIAASSARPSWTRAVPASTSRGPARRS